MADNQGPDITERLRLLGKASPLGMEAADEIERMRRDARWLMNLILADYSNPQGQEERIPEHACDFVYRPDMGACTFHEEWFAVAERIGLMDEWADEAIASQS